MNFGVSLSLPPETLVESHQNFAQYLYTLIDSGHSVQFSPDADPSSYLGTWTVPDSRKLPPGIICSRRLSDKPYNILMVQEIIDDILGVLAVLQDMPQSRPHARLNVTDACSLKPPPAL